MTGLMRIKTNGVVNAVEIFSKGGTTTVDRRDMSVRDRNELDRRLVNYWCDYTGFERVYDE